MLKAVGSRLTYANVVATGALFVALGGGAYALSGVPDRAGVFHGCVSNATGVLRVVKSASSCQKAKTVRRNGKRVRLPGEFAVAWNQKGQPGGNGTNGINGTNGTNGSNGATNVTVRTATGSPATHGTESTALAECNAGEHETGGGVSVTRTNGGVYSIQESGPNGGGWSASALETETTGSSTITVTAYALCASP